MIGLWCGLAGSAARAGDAELRDTAKQFGCPVKKITLLRQKAGVDSEQTYKVDCNLPKATEQKDAAPPSITVTCRMNLCQVAR